MAGRRRGTPVTHSGEDGQVTGRGGGAHMERPGGRGPPSGTGARATLQGK